MKNERNWCGRREFRKEPLFPFFRTRVAGDLQRRELRSLWQADVLSKLDYNRTFRALACYSHSVLIFSYELPHMCDWGFLRVHSNANSLLLLYLLEREESIHNGVLLTYALIKLIHSFNMK